MNTGRSTLKTLLMVAGICALQACVSSGGPRVSDAEAAQANLNLGVAYLRQGRPDLAIENLERALNQDPRLATAHSSIALAYDQLGNTEDAERHYRRAAQLESADPQIANLYGVFLCRQNRWSEAEPYFRRAVSNPSNPAPVVALTNAGFCARGAGDTDRAEDYLRQALSLDPAFPDALAGLMELAYSREEYLPARAFMQRYREVRPATAPVLLLCFNIERALEDHDAAERCARQLREEFPRSPELERLTQFERDAQ